MRADNDSADLGLDGLDGPNEGIQEESLDWLLDMDRSEPEEKLFALDEEEFQEDGLSEYEAELAARPLTSGANASVDDLSLFIEEEIVVSSENSSSDIFSDTRERGQSSGQNGNKAMGEAKAIVHSRKHDPVNSVADASVQDGSDILGLAEDDDMGEAFLTIKRVKGKRRAKAPRQKTVPETGQETPEQDLAAGAVEVAAKEESSLPPVAEPVASTAVAQHEAELPESHAGEETNAGNWLEKESLTLGEIEPALNDDLEALSSPVNVELGLDDLELTALTDTQTEEEATEPEPNDWLGDVDMEFADLDDVAGQDSAVQAAADVEGDDWLGEIELELMSEEPIQVEQSEQDVSASESVEEGVELIQVETAALLEETESAQSTDSSSEWLGSSDLELYEMVDDNADDFDLALPLDLENDGFLTDVAEDESTLPDTASDALILSEASGTGLVAEPGEHTVANEEAVAQGVDGVEDGAGQKGDNVLEYVAQHKAPLGDEEFDEYLLRGADLAASTPDMEDLEVERTEGIVSVDPGTDVDIDYHDDFRALEGLGSDSLSAITAVISPVMDEISSLARDRMECLGQAADAIEVDVMLAADSAAVSQCRSEGYEQVGAICAELPAALADLGQAEVEAIYVRLFNGQTGEIQNDLFHVELPEVAEVTDAPEAMEAAEQGEMELESKADEVEVAVFGEDVFGEDFLDDLDDESLPDSSADIDMLFDDLADGAGEMDSLDEFTLPEEEPAEEAVEQLQTAEAEEPDAQLADSSGFGEDIFSADLSGDFEELTEGDTADIDTVFASLDAGEADSGEICGLDVDEFEVAEDVEVLEAVAEYAEARSTQQSRNDSDMSWCIPQGIAFDHSSQGNGEIFADFLDAFIEEGAATVEKLEDAIGEWEKSVSDEAAFSPVARILHTLKGIAKGVGLQRYGTLIHNFETLLEGMARPEPGAEPDYFRIVNAWLDAAVRGLEFVQENRVDVGSEFPAQNTEVASGDAVGEVEEASSTVEKAPDAAKASPVVTDKAAERQKKRDQQLADEGAKALAAQQSVRITSEKLDHLLNLTNQAQQLGVRSAQSTNRSKRASAEMQGRLSSVRTHIARIADRALLNVTARGGQQLSSELDALEMDQYSELQEAANILREAVEDLSDLVDVSSRHNAVLEAQLKQQATVISTIGSSIQAARVVPVSRLMPGLRRIVRTVSTDLDKSVAFKVLNETGALDRDHHARCQVILEHMVRNALDHGIESPEERLAVGKATTGRITIDVRKSGADYYITLTDDGRGIDPYEMRESAFRKGLDLDVDALSDEEAIQLIFHKGFSTANAVSEISGRGVGMDIVLSELQQIGGGIKVQSTVGLGTTFEVHVPANVTVNGALFVTVSDNSYAIPLNGLVAVDHVPVADYFNAVERGNTLTLSDLECEPAYLATLCHGQSLPDRDTWGETVPVIIAGSDKRYMAIAVDNLEEALELVIRSLGPQFANVPGVAGGATTADGEAIVALDLNLLVESVSTGKMSAVAVEENKDRTLLALVVDDSRTQRMVTTSQFDTVGVETITAENGLVAIDLLNTTHRLPDVVLLDVEMPVKDGIETLREIRKSMRYKHLPVIMVTSRTGAKHRALAEEAGCDGYMGKPFNFPGLIEQINELTGYDLQVS